MAPTAQATAQWGGARALHEPPGFEFPVGSGWQGRVAGVRTARDQLLAMGALQALNGGAAPRVAGRLRVAVVPLLFQDASTPFPAADYRDLLFSPFPVDRRWSATSFYQAQSRGALLLEGEVFDWVRLPRPEAYYTDGCNGIGVATPCPVRDRHRMRDLLEDALQVLSTGSGAATRWRGFDNDGPDGIPDSGDDDGVVDLVIFLHPTVDGACGGAGLWSHRFGVGSWAGGAPWVTASPRPGRPGEFIRVNAYTLQSAVGGDNACTGSDIMPVGTVAHETGHAFGLPDLYDTEALFPSSGIGEWGLMGAGNYARPNSPASFDAWTLMQLGWVTVDTLRSGVEVVAGPVQRSDTVYLARSIDPGQWLLLENRQALAPDSAMMDLGFIRPKGPGLLIWRIDDARIREGWEINRVNTGARQGVVLLQADGFDQLGARGATRNRGDAGDPWPGTHLRTVLGLATAPSATRWDGLPLELRIDRISTLPDGRIRFRYLRRAPSLIASRAPTAMVRVDALRVHQYREVLAPGDTISLGADAVQVALDGRSRAEFVGWSDGAARDRDYVVPDGPPDTLWADFRVDHRLRVQITGAGAVQASQPDLIGGGAFLPQGTTVTLTATPPTGMLFLGWLGDTAATTAAITLKVDRPYDLRARFLPAVTIDPVAVLRAVTGGPALSPEVGVYLDAAGNGNGITDIGDYLAWLHRSGQTIPAVPGVWRP